MNSSTLEASQNKSGLYYEAIEILPRKTTIIQNMTSE